MGWVRVLTPSLLLMAFAIAPSPGGAAIGDTESDHVLGQLGSFTTGNCNFSVQSAPPTAQSLCGPSGLAFDPAGNIYVADVGNNRVLRIDDPLGGDDAADAVFGQGGAFDSSGCNVGGVSAGSLCLPRSVAVDGAGNVFVADDVNHRVLGYVTPLTTDTIADVVMGQADFTSVGCNVGGISAASLCVPVGVAADSAGNLYVADFNNSRVLQYDAPLATDGTADRVVGQSGSFSSAVCDLGGLSASSLCTPRNVAVDAAGNLYVADFGNDRLLEFDSPFTTDTLADRVFGQGGSFTSGFCNMGGIHAGSLCNPYSASIAGTNDLYVVDRNNHRVLEYYDPLSSDDAADRVFGQAEDFTSGDCNHGGITATSLCIPGAVLVDGQHNLWIADIGNNRVLGFDAPADRDGDGLADMDDADDDGDSVDDVLEGVCGSSAIYSSSRPERVDGVFAGADDDGDALVDEALPSGTAGFDCDGDGYKGSAESGTPLCGDGRNEDNLDDGVIDDGCQGGPPQVGTFSEAQFNIGLTDQDPCGTNGWASDFVSDGVPSSTNKVTITDLTSFLAPTRRLDKSPGHPDFDSRWDLVPGPGLFAQWINISDLTALLAGPTGYPPMLGGARAFSHATGCQWAP